MAPPAADRGRGDGAATNRPRLLPTIATALFSPFNAAPAHRLAAFWSYIVPGGPDDCWPWTSTVTPKGYGQFNVTGRSPGGRPRSSYVHRVMYEHVIGPIPSGHTVDHVCHNRARDCPGGDGCRHRRCANPAHLEAVPGRVNTLRGKSFAAKNARKTHCTKGHPLADDNLLIKPDGRACRTCDLAGKRDWYARNRVEISTRRRERRRAAKPARPDVPPHPHRPGRPCTCRRLAAAGGGRR